MKALIPVSYMLLLGLSACSDPQATQEEHLLAPQQQAIEDAKLVEEMFKIRDAEQRQQIDEQSR